MQEQPNPFGTPGENPSPAVPPPYGAPIPAPTGQMYGGLTNTGANDSGTGATAVLPEELKGFSWAAFLMSWIWSIAHNTWIGLLVFIPYLGWIMAFVLGFKGNEWAWQNRKWDSIEQFRETQKVWTKWGIGLLLFGAVMGVLAGVLLVVLGHNVPVTTTTTTTFQPPQ